MCNISYRVYKNILHKVFIYAAFYIQCFMGVGLFGTFFCV